MTDPLGIRQNNPFNLRPGSEPWLGELSPKNGYCTFIDPEHGIRAGCKNLIAYQDKHGLHNVATIIPRWAPAKDHNNVQAYINAVCADMGVSATQDLDLHDPITLASLAQAMIRHENGFQPYSLILIDKAVAEALGGAEW